MLDFTLNISFSVNLLSQRLHTVIYVFKHQDLFVTHFKANASTLKVGNMFIVASRDV